MGEKRDGGRVETAVRISGAETGGAYSVVEQRHPVGRGAPLHAHRFETETLLVVEGTYVVLVAGEARRLTAGQSVSLPPGVPHAFANNGKGSGRLLILAVPAGIEGYFSAMSELDWDSSGVEAEVAELEARYGIVRVVEEGG